MGGGERGVVKEGLSMNCAFIINRARNHNQTPSNYRTPTNNACSLCPRTSPVPAAVNKTLLGLRASKRGMQPRFSASAWTWCTPQKIQLQTWSLLAAKGGVGNAWKLFPCILVKQIFHWGDIQSSIQQSLPSEDGLRLFSRELCTGVALP